MRSSSDIPGVEARAWYSPSQETYYVQRWREGISIQVWIAPEGKFVTPGETVSLPEDAFEIGANPTEYAYANARGAAMEQHERAIAAEGRIERMRKHVMRTLNAPNLPLESLVDLLLARTGGEPLAPVPARPPGPPRPPNFNSALARLTEIAGDRADSSAWGTVVGAITTATAGHDVNLFREVIELARVVRVDLSEQERNPEWLKS